MSGSEISKQIQKYFELQITIFLMQRSLEKFKKFKTRGRILKMIKFEKFKNSPLK
jgi:hypothetical protein